MATLVYTTLTGENFQLEVDDAVFAAEVKEHLLRSHKNAA